MLGGERLYGRRRRAGGWQEGELGDGMRARGWGLPWCRCALLLAGASPGRLAFAAASCAGLRKHKPTWTIEKEQISVWTLRSVALFMRANNVGGADTGARWQSRTASSLARLLRCAGWRAVTREEEGSWGRAVGQEGERVGLTVVPPCLAFGRVKPWPVGVCGCELRGLRGPA